MRQLCRQTRRTCTAHHIFNHFYQSHLHAVVGVVDALNAVRFQLADFLWGDGAATTSEHADMRRVALFQHIHHVFEVFNMATLVGRQRDGIGIFLQCRPHHVFHAAVMPQMNNFCALRLNQAAHDIDRGIVAIE